MQVLLVLIDIEQPGRYLALGGALADRHQCGICVARIVTLVELMQHQARAVVQCHGHRCAFLVVSRDLAFFRHEVELVDRLVVRAHVLIALGGCGVVVEGHARTDDVEEGEAAIADGRLDQRNELALVTRKRAGDEAGAELDRHLAKIDRIERVWLALLRRRSLVVGRRELALGQPIAAVVHHDIDHVELPPDNVPELTEPDRGGIAIARHADVDEVPVCEVRPRRHRRHAPVHAVEAVAAPQEVGRSLGGAADAGNLRHAVRGQVQLEARLDDGGRDRVVPAPRAQRRHRALVVAMGQAERVLLERRMIGGGLLDVAHLDILTPPRP